MSSFPSLKELNRVITLARGFLPRSFDVETLALDILMECWHNNCTRPSLSMIKYRCIDLIRQKALEERKLKHYAKLRGEQHEPSILNNLNNSLQVESLVEVLDPQERKLIALRFYVGLSIKKIAEQIRLSEQTVREILTGALYKMRLEAESKSDV